MNQSNLPTHSTVQPKRIPKRIKVLHWLYQQTLEKKPATTLASVHANADTSFRTHISKIQKLHGIHICSNWVSNPHTHTSYKEYMLSQNSMLKTQEILARYGLLEVGK